METLRKKTISEVHFQHRVWLNELSFYKVELKIFRERLEEVAGKNIGNNEMHVGVEQFQNKILIQLNEADMLRHDINENEQKAVESGELHIRRIDYVASELYNTLAERMEIYRKLYNELKKNFYDFIAEWM